MYLPTECIEMYKIRGIVLASQSLDSNFYIKFWNVIDTFSFKFPLQSLFLINPDIFFLYIFSF